MIQESIDNLKKRVQLLGDSFYSGKINSDPTIINDIFSLYNTIFKEVWENKKCTSCYADCFFTIINLSKEKIKEMESLKYELKPGILLQGYPYGDSSKNCTKNNLTNELAEWHLKNNPGCEIYFSVLPSDWKEIAGRKEEVKKNKKEVTKTTVLDVEKKRPQLITEVNQLIKEGKLDQNIKPFKLSNEELIKLL